MAVEVVRRTATTTTTADICKSRQDSISDASKQSLFISAPHVPRGPCQQNGRLANM
jgi:hypothetical protein